MRSPLGFRWLFSAAALLTLFVAGDLAAQSGATVAGRVTDEGGAPLAGAQVVVTSTAGYQNGALAGADGRYRVEDVPAGGPYKVQIQMLGYGTSEVQVAQLAAGQTRTVDFVLSSQAVALKEIAVFATRAEERKTPVAFTDVPKVEIARKLASRDLPMVLNTTPGVYATEQGGGAGDSRINVRGFNQRNVAVMINGVPVNDMENGWVYWSNWDGLGDATSSVQIQRGMGTSNLAVPSIGGTMNILTDAAAIRPGVNFKQEFGSGNFLKSTLSVNTGLLNDKFALSFVGVRKQGDGVPDYTWTDAWAYFGSASYQVNDKHRIQAFLVGAPQQHAQRRFKMKIASWDKEYAEELGIDTNDSKNYQRFYPVGSFGREYNMNWGPINAPAEDLKEFYNDEVHDIRDGKFVDETVNYFHKPQANINWYYTPTDRLSLTNVFYLSLGKGGGSGSYGSFPTRYSDSNSEYFGQYDWQRVYQANTTNVVAADVARGVQPGETRGKTVLRNSVNRHTWFGWVGNASYDFSTNIKLTGGIDARYYEGRHWREIRNMLGADYFVDTNRSGSCIDSNDTSGCVRRLGDKIAYWDKGLVRWYGAFGQAEGTWGDLTTIVSASLSQTGFKRIDYFRPKVDGKPDETDWVNQPGYKLTGGANYNLTETINVFGSAGYISKPPTFGGIFDFSNNEFDPIFNEKVTSAELGAKYRTEKFAAQVSLYNTDWKDRSWTGRIRTDEKDYVFLLRGIDARHQGVELEAKFRPADFIEFNGAVSLGDWRWMNDVSTEFAPEDNPAAAESFDIYTKDLKVGDAAQTTYSLTTSLYPTTDLYLDVALKHFDNYYADFDPEDRTDPTDRTQSWKAPAYSLVDVHAGYTLPFRFRNRTRLQATLNVVNLFDEVYVSDAVDGGKHDAAGAQAFLGLPRTINAGLKVTF